MVDISICSSFSTCKQLVYACIEARGCDFVFCDLILFPKDPRRRSIEDIAKALFRVGTPLFAVVDLFLFCFSSSIDHIHN